MSAPSIPRRVLLLFVVGALIATACSGNGDDETADTAATADAADTAATAAEEPADAGAAEGAVIGLSMHFLADDYAQVFADTVAATGEEVGLEVLQASADGDPQKQLSDIESYVSQGVDALIVIPIDEAAVIPALRTASEAGIPVLSASPVPGAEDSITSVVGPSDFENGRATCNEMVEAMAEAGNGMDVAISTASVILYRIEQREEGCRAALDEAGANVVAEETGLSPEEGLANAQNLLSAHPRPRRHLRFVLEPGDRRGQCAAGGRAQRCERQRHRRRQRDRPADRRRVRHLGGGAVPAGAGRADHPDGRGRHRR